MATKVGKGIPGLGKSQGSTFRTWSGKGFKALLGEVTAKPKLDDEEREIGVSVKVPLTFIGGPKQHDDTDPKGKKATLFMNVDYSKDFTIDQLADLFLAAGVKIEGDIPNYAKLEDKEVPLDLYERPNPNGGAPFQGFRFIHSTTIGKGKAKARARASDDDED